MKEYFKSKALQPGTLIEYIKIQNVIKMSQTLNSTSDKFAPSDIHHDWQCHEKILLQFHFIGIAAANISLQFVIKVTDISHNHHQRSKNCFLLSHY